MSKHELKFKGVLDKTDITAHLENLVQALRQGRINLQHNDEILSLNPGARIKMEIKAEIKPEKEKIELEITWRDNMELSADTGALVISGTLPDMEEAPGEPTPEEQGSGRTPASSGPAIEADGEDLERKERE